MKESDIGWLRWRDIAVALSLLSRWPLRLPQPAYTRSAQAVWAYPLAGFLIALPVAVLAKLCLGLGISVGLTALLALACLTVTTGAIHEDGLADCADGLWGGHDKARRLEIMQDSQIGTYGVLALVFSLGLRWSALTALFETGAVAGPILAAAAVSRASPTLLMHGLPRARRSGLSQSVGTPAAGHVGLAVFLALLLTLTTLQTVPVLTLLATAGATAGCAIVAYKKIQGQTGDILGATQQVTEITFLMCLALHA